MNTHKKYYLLKGHIEICRFDHWIKNIFILPGILIAISLYPQGINSNLFFIWVVTRRWFDLKTSDKNTQIINYSEK